MYDQPTVAPPTHGRRGRPPRDPVAETAPVNEPAVAAAAGADDEHAGPRHRAGPADRSGPADPSRSPWRLLVTAHDLVRPSDLINHPENARAHPKPQQEAVRAAIHELGFVGEILVSKRSGRILDGHLRVAEALRDGQEVVPVGWVECDSDEQELAILATHDPLGAMATADRTQLAALAEKARITSGPLQTMLAQLATRPTGRPAEEEPGGRVIGSAFGPQGGGHGGHLGLVAGLVHPVVVECPSEEEAEVLLEQLADDGHAAYLLPASPSSLAERF